MKNKRSSKKNSRISWISTTVLVILILALIGLVIGFFEDKGIINPSPMENSYNDTSTIEMEKEDIVTSDNSGLTTYEEPAETNSTDSTLDTTDISLNENDSEITESTEEKSYKGTIYLTFDDGPSENVTPKILDILDKYQIKATFFLVGSSINSTSTEELVLREYNSGHSIGLHGMSHDYSTIYASLDSLISNYTEVSQKVYDITGFTSKIIRFPGGSSNTVSKKYCNGIMTEAAEYFTNNGYQYYDWNVESGDAGGTTDTQTVIENVTSAINDSKDYYVLMHDASTKEFSCNALEEIIIYGLENGYKFEAITNSTTPCHHNIAN